MGGQALVLDRQARETHGTCCGTESPAGMKHKGHVYAVKIAPTQEFQLAAQVADDTLFFQAHAVFRFDVFLRRHTAKADPAGETIQCPRLF